MKVFLLAIGAGLAWGIGEVFTKSVLHSKQVGPLAAISVRTTVELPILWIAWMLASRAWPSEPRQWWLADTGTLAKLVCGSGLIAGAIGMICFYSALGLGEVSRVKPIAFSIAPATGVILGWLVLGEEMNLRKAAAIGLILAGVVLLTINPRRAEATAAPHAPDAAPGVGR